MATVTAIEYSGLIWCPTVSTGAFVARRNGKVFITGNSGFPKSLDVSKAIDKAAGAEREVVGYDARKAAQQTRAVGTASYGDYAGNAGDVTAPATDAARQWQGWGTALKPALEPITVARKPLIGTVAANVLAHGTGAINVDGCRVTDGTESGAKKPEYVANNNNKVYGAGMGGGDWENTAGRWPANLIHDGSDEVLALAGDAARYFYCAKASKSDRGEGNNHPTVKPTDLMRYLCRLVTPPGGTVLDPFMGSGSTGVAAQLEGFKFIGIERDPAYVAIARSRGVRG